MVPCSNGEMVRQEQGARGRRKSYPSVTTREIDFQEIVRALVEVIAHLFVVSNVSQAHFRDFEANRSIECHTPKDCNILLATEYRTRLKDEFYGFQPILQRSSGRNELRPGKTVVEISVEQGAFVVGCGIGRLQRPEVRIVQNCLVAEPPEDLAQRLRAGSRKAYSPDLGIAE